MRYPSLAVDAPLTSMATCGSGVNGSGSLLNMGIVIPQKGQNIQVWEAVQWREPNRGSINTIEDLVHDSLYLHPSCRSLVARQ